MVGFSSALSDVCFKSFEPSFIVVLVSNNPIIIQTVSRMRVIRLMEIAQLEVSPNPPNANRKPPSLVPSCNGVKKSTLANSDVNAMIKIQSI